MQRIMTTLDNRLRFFFGETVAASGGVVAGFSCVGSENLRGIAIPPLRCCWGGTVRTPSFDLPRGTTIPFPQCGHCATWPQYESSASTVCPHCGHLNSKVIVLFLSNHLPRLPCWVPPLRRGRKESGAPSKSHFVVGAAKNLNEKQERGHAAWIPRDAPSYLVFRHGKLAALPRNLIRCCVCPRSLEAARSASAPYRCEVAVAGRPPYQ